VKNGRISFETILIALVLVSHLTVALAPANSLMNWYTTDDAFYYFKTAQNAAEGYGLSFDRIGLSSGFHPLWMLICIPVFTLARFDLILPLRLLVLIQAALAAATGVLVYRLGKRAFSPEVAALAALAWVFTPRIHATTTQLGMESGISAFFIALLLFQLTRLEDLRAAGKPFRGALLALSAAAVGALFSRLDNAFLTLVAGAWVVFRTPNLRSLLVADLLTIAAGVFASFILRLGAGSAYYQYLPSAYWMLVLALIIRPLSYYVCGLYRRPWAEGWGRLALRLLLASAAATALLAGVMTALSAGRLFAGFPRAILLIEAGIALGSAALVRLALWGLARVQSGQNPAVWVSPPWQIDLKTQLPLALRYFLPLGLALGAYVAASYAYFGTLSPVSGQIKHWWGTLPNTVYGKPIESLIDFLGYSTMAEGPWALAIGLLYAPAGFVLRLLSIRDAAVVSGARLGSAMLLMGLGVYLLVRQRHYALAAIRRLGLFPLLAGCYAQIISYTGSYYVNARIWYWVAEMMLTILFGGVLLECLLRSLPSVQKHPRALRLGSAAIGVLLLTAFGANLFRQVPLWIYPENTYAYLSGVRALERETEPGSLIGSPGGGVVAYFIQDRTIVNLDGLMNSVEYFEALKAGRPEVYLDQIGLDYIHANRYMFPMSDPYFPFKDHIQPIKVIQGLTLYRYIPTRP